MTHRLRAGIVGPGFIGGVHARAVLAAGGLLSRVAASTFEQAASAAERLMIDHPAASAEELISAPDVDVVHICTPNFTHTPLAELAIRAGKHVVCEKPLATTPADARRLTAAATQARVLATVPFVYRYYPTVREARARIGRGEAGPLRVLHGSYLQDWLSGNEENNWRVDPALGGTSRAFGDIGVHWCDLMEFATGHRITRLTAKLVTAAKQPRSGDGPVPVLTEDGAIVLFETDRGASGSVVLSQISLGRKNRLWFSFDGDAASYVFDQELPDSLGGGGPGPRNAVCGDATLRAAARRPSAGLSGLLQRIHQRQLRSDMRRSTRRAPHLRRRPARGDPDRRGPRIGRQRELGRGAELKPGFLAKTRRKER